MAGKSRIAVAAAAVKKNLLGSAIAQPNMVEMPQAVHELHVSEDDVIPAGTVITDEIAELAGLSDKDVTDLIEKGAVKLVEVYAASAPEPAGEQPEA